MYRFHISLHALPDELDPPPENVAIVELDGLQFAALDVRPSRSAAPFSISFEDAAEALSMLPRMFVEPDGSFVWVDQNSRWQVDGSLYDRDGRLVYVELKGSCPVEQFDQLLAAFGWPRQSMMFQLTTHAVFLDEKEFRRWQDRQSR